jgi:hypothetical protein
LRETARLGPAASPAERTDVSELSGSFTIRSAVVESRDLRLISPQVQLTGGGAILLSRGAVNLAGEATFASAMPRRGNDLVPIRITGGWSDPTVTIDRADFPHQSAGESRRARPMPLIPGLTQQDVAAVPPAGEDAIAVPTDPLPTVQTPSMGMGPRFVPRYLGR